MLLPLYSVPLHYLLTLLKNSFVAVLFDWLVSHSLTHSVWVNASQPNLSALQEGYCSTSGEENGGETEEQSEGRMAKKKC